MTVTTSSHFASSIHGGADWREAAKQVLDDLSDVQTGGEEFTLGFVYITDHLAADVGNILTLFQSVLNIKDWIGCVGVGVLGTDKVRIDQPAIAAMIGRFDPQDFHLIASRELDAAALQEWLGNNDPMLVLTHEHPEEDPHIMRDLKDLEENTGGFLVGGISICRAQFFPKTAREEAHENRMLAGIDMLGGHSCVAFSNRVPVSVSLSQGCTPIGETHTISKSHDNVILQLDSLQAQTVFEDDLRSMAMKKIGRDPHNVMVQGGQIPPELQNVFTGEVLVGFPVAETDGDDMAVRNILGLNEDGSMMVDYHPHPYQSLVFVHRDDETMKADLSTKILALRKRIEREYGPITPATIKGGIYISCAARAFTEEGAVNDSERAIIHDILGDFPLCGFYAGGEIKGTQLYGYTGILSLFL